MRVETTPMRLRAGALPGESAAGHLMRLFEINGEPWSRERFRTRGLNLADCLTGGGVEFLRAFDVDPRPFEATTAPVTTYRIVEIAGERLHRDDWSTNLRRWCPACFADDLQNVGLGGRAPGWRLHRRFWWDAVCLTTCPIHAVRLERCCPTCGDDVVWMTGSLTTCRNRHSLIECTPAPIDGALCAADAYVVGRLGGMPATVVPFLDALPLRDAIDAIERIGVADLAGPLGALAKFDEAGQLEVRASGLATVAGWPGSFDRVLDKLAARPDVTADAASQDHVYGYLVIWARSIRKTALGEAFLSAILAHHAKRSAARAGAAASRFADDSSPLSLVQIAEALDIGATAARAMLVALDRWPKGTKSGAAVLFPPEIVSELRDVLADHAKEEDLPELLGLAMNQAKALVAAGKVKPLPLIQTAALRRKRFSRSAIAGWLTKLAGDAPEVDVVPAALMPLPSACRGSNAGGVPGLTDLIEEGAVKVRARLAGVHGVRSLLVDKNAVKRAARARSGGDLSPKEAAELMAMNPDSVWSCIHDGLLDWTPHGSQGAAITRAGVQKFRRTYVTTSEFANSMGSLPRYVAEVLRECGVLPVPFKTEKSRLRVAVYRRADIPRDFRERYRRRFALSK